MTIGLSDGTSHESELDLLLSSSNMEAYDSSNIQDKKSTPTPTRVENSQQMKKGIDWLRGYNDLLPAGALEPYIEPAVPGETTVPDFYGRGANYVAANIDPRNNPYSKEKLGEGAGGTIPTRVDRTALKYKDKVYTGDKGNSHFELMDKVPKDAKFTEVEDGFVTNTGKFLTRHEANMLSAKTEQLPLDQFKQNIQQGRGLISEDLPEINAARWEKRINMMEEMQKKSSRWDDLMPSDEFSSFVKELKDFVNTNVLKKR